ncbi:MAG: hypothetical protein ACRDHU_07810 [Actinomycetota bacterium]
MSARAPARVGTGRRKTFRIVAGVLGGLAVGLSVPFAVASLVDDGQAIHRMHNLAFTALYGVLLGAALLSCARDPERNVSAFLVAVASGIAGTIAGLASGDFISGTWFTAPISIVILVVLHPRRAELGRWPGVDPPTAVLSVVAFVPATAWLLTQAELQRNGVAGDPHWDLHHYSGMAAAALGLALCGLAASLRVSGRRTGVWVVGVSALMVGGGSLLLSDHVGAFDAAWAWLTLAWGLGLVARAEMEARKESTDR